ncbi:hypothetical protein [Cellulomonas sp. ICMP 17802]|uniref:hypothetical protein n=1 Tax=Cellulomonas sp. ICMP 17802 TaxID=3239199 RepID=UPI00351B1F22
MGGRQRVELGGVARREVAAQRVAEVAQRELAGARQVVDAVEPVVGVEQGADALERTRGDAGLGAQGDPREERVGAGDLGDGALLVIGGTLDVARGSPG